MITAHVPDNTADAIFFDFLTVHGAPGFPFLFPVQAAWP